MPISALKIDRSLIAGILHSAEDQAVTEALVNLSHRLGMRVVAEGVETEALMRRLDDLGCDEAQGYVISPPLPPVALEAWLVDRVTGLRVPEPMPRPGAAMRPLVVGAETSAGA